MIMIFVVTISLLLHVGLTECQMKLKRLDNVEKTFLELNKRCQQLTGIERDAYFWQLGSEFKTEIYSLKEDITRLREQHQARLDMSEESHRMVLEERLQKSKQLYIIKEKETIELNIEINRLRQVLEKLEAINSYQNKTIESSNTFIQQLQVQMELSETKIQCSEIEIKGSLLSTTLRVFLTVLGVVTTLLWFFIAIHHRHRGRYRKLSVYSVMTALEIDRHPRSIYDILPKYRKSKNTAIDKEGSSCIEDDDKTQNIITSDKEVFSCIEYHDKLLNNLHEMQEPIEWFSTKCTEIDKRITNVQKILSDIKRNLANEISNQKI